MIVVCNGSVPNAVYQVLIYFSQKINITFSIITNISKFKNLFWIDWISITVTLAIKIFTYIKLTIFVEVCEVNWDLKVRKIENKNKDSKIAWNFEVFLELPVRMEMKLCPEIYTHNQSYVLTSIYFLKFLQIDLL